MEVERGWIGLACFTGAMASSPTLAHADEPIVLRDTWGGQVGFFATGAPMAIDGPDEDTTSVDLLAQPADVVIGPPDVPAGAELRAAILYWGGSIANSECSDPSDIDDEVDFTPPGGLPQPLLADACFCSVAGSMAYDVQLCRADVTALVPTLEGTYTVDAFDALIGNQTTHNASFSIVLVYGAVTLPPRRIALYDGLLTMSSDTTSEETISLGGLDIDDPPSGDLTWYVLEGDIGGSGGEGVEVRGMPGGGVLALGDASNPVGNPMNNTINTTMPVQTDTLGVDVDRFAIDDALAVTDDAVEVRYTAGIDKWWLAYDIVGVNVFEPVLSNGSEKSWQLQDDADGDGGPSPGDTIRYTLHLNNTGNTDAIVAVTDPIPSEATSWALVSTGGGTDISLGDTLVVIDVPVPVGGVGDVVVDIVIDEVPDATLIGNIAQYVAEPGAIVGQLVAPVVEVGNPVVGTGGQESTGSGSSTGAAETSAGSSDAGMSTGLADTSGGGSGVADDTGAGPGSSGAGVGETGGATGVGLTGGAVEPSGCGCRHESGPGPWWWAFALLGVRRRLRRSARSPPPRCPDVCGEVADGAFSLPGRRARG